MFWLYASVIGLVVGMTIGWTVEQVRVAPLVQSLVAFVTALLLGTVLATVVWFLRPSASGGLGAVSAGIGAETLFYLGVLGAVPVALHVGLGHVGGVAPLLARHRATVLGLLGGLCGALFVAWLMAVSTS